MPEKKRKARDGTIQISTKPNKRRFNRRNERDGGMRKKSGPRLPSALRKQLDRINPDVDFNSEDEEEEIHSDVAGDDVYEYEEGVAEEESKKNRRYDPVENYEYELPHDFEDEDVESDNEDDGDVKRRGESDDEMDDEEEYDDEKHSRMLQGITGMPSEAFEGKGKAKKNFIVSEAYPESEYNPSHGVINGGDRVTVDDLLQSIQGKPAYSKIRRRTYEMAKKTERLLAPLPRVAQDKLERLAAHEKSKKDLVKWEPLIKRNRENPTLIFDQDTDLGFSTVGAIASEFEPRTDFEKKMASLLRDENFVEAHKEDGAKLLELNKISAEDYKEHRDRVAKMRSLLFRHEVKMKRIKKIKSKTFARKSKKDRLKSLTAEVQMDPEAAKELAMKLEFERAEERMTLRHKNSSKWARRILERGLSVQDEGTKAALSEHFQQHERLTRKNFMKNNSSSDDSSDEEDDDNSTGSDEDEAFKASEKAKQKILKELEDDNDVPKSGLFSLPFMERGLKKQKEATVEHALQVCESLSNQLLDKDGGENSKTASVSGRRVFGSSNKPVLEPCNKRKLNDNSSSGSDDELEAEEIEVVPEKTNNLLKDVKINYSMFSEDAETNQDPVFKDFDGIVEEADPKKAYEVSIFASNSWKKMKSQSKEDIKTKKPPSALNVALPTQNLDPEGVEGHSDSESEGHMVDGILTSGSKNDYELPSQAELIHEAFAADDVEEEFAESKEGILNEEVPEPEKPVLLPGWGQWTNVQKKKGLPSWMVEEHEIAKRKREEALKKRKDAQLRNVIISEKLDKKAEKLLTKTLPYPFTSKDVFEQSIRMPIGPESNPATALRALNRPEVVKKPGVIIKPIKYEDVDPYKKGGDQTKNGGADKHKNHRVNKNRSKLKPILVKS